MKPSRLILITLITCLLLVGGVQAVTWTSANGCWTSQDGAYTVVMFNSTGPRTYTVPSNIINVTFFVVAGGGGGGRESYLSGFGGGGGAGGVLTGYASVLPGSTQPITVGDGGNGYTGSGGQGSDGGISLFSSYTATGGGGGGGGATSANGRNGGSGGGAGNTAGVNGTGIFGQGYGGGAGVNAVAAGGGGGASQRGNTKGQGYGGDGISSSISGVLSYYGGGGGGSGGASLPGGSGGGGTGARNDFTEATNGTPNTGGGGGGSGNNGAATPAHGGGSGIVFLRYLTAGDVPPQTYKPMLRGAQIGEYYDGAATVQATRFTSDGDWNQISEFTTGGSASAYDTTNGWLTLADATSIYPTAISMGQGHYAFQLKRSTGATDVFNCNIAGNAITTTGAGVTTIGGTAYTGTALTSPVWLEFVATGTQIAVYSNGVLIGTKTGLTLTPGTIQLSRTTANIYVLAMNFNALDSTSPNGISASLGGVPHGAMYYTNNTAAIYGADPLTVQFSDVSAYYSPMNPVLTRNWSYQGISATNNTKTTFATDASPLATFGGGNFSIQLDDVSIGGTNSSAQTFWVNVSAIPVSEFSSFNDAGTTAFSTYFYDLSTNIIPGQDTYYWMFGDGNTSTQKNLYYTYNTTGTYSVNHSASNGALTSWNNKSAYITVIPKVITPVASFYGGPQIGAPPLTVFFTDVSTNTPTSWNWSVGDGTYYETQNPSHVYTGSGFFTVNLTATNSAGSDTSTQTNFVMVY